MPDYPSIAAAGLSLAQEILSCGLTSAHYGASLGYSRGYPMTYGQAEDLAAFLSTIRQQPHEDTNWLALADWLQDEGLHPQSPDRIRWWMAARNHMRPRRSWAETPAPESRVTQLGPDWVARLFGVENARHVFDRYWPSSLWASTRNIVDDTLSVAERFALGVASDEERNRARNSARTSSLLFPQHDDQDPARNAVQDASWTAAQLAHDAPSLPLVRDSVANSVWWGSTNPFQEELTNGARWAFTSSQDALDEFTRDNPVPNSRW